MGKFDVLMAHRRYERRFRFRPWVVSVGGVGKSCIACAWGHRRLELLPHWLIRG
jgi:hypothetical protein